MLSICPTLNALHCIAGCPTLNALLCIARCPTPNALLCIVRCPTLNGLLLIARCPTSNFLLHISVPYFIQTIDTMQSSASYENRTPVSAHYHYLQLLHSFVFCAELNIIWQMSQSGVDVVALLALKKGPPRSLTNECHFGEFNLYISIASGICQFASDTWGLSPKFAATIKQT